MKTKFLKNLVLVPLLLGCSPKAYSVIDYRLTMEFHEDFKILQLTDLHFGIESDLKSQFDFVKDSILEANPDLIILTGDNFMYSSEGTVKSTIKFFNDACNELTSKNNRLTKFAMTFGNHDNQGDYHRYFINETLNKYVTSNGNEVKDNKYAAYVDYENDNIFGLTNYYIDLINPNDKEDVKYRLHIIDSNTYEFQGFKYGYDHIREDQLKHINNIYQTATSDKDYIGLAFFHIPFINYKEAMDQFYASNEDPEIGRGSFKDKSHFPAKDVGSYKEMKKANIIGYFVGHDHKNYGDLLYKDENGDKALFSYGVKSSNQLYHYDEIIGYKTITLKENITKEQFLTMEYVNENIVNVYKGEDQYGK